MTFCAEAQPGAGRQDFDVLIYGATPAGVLAAVAAARRGSRVGVVNPDPVVGGLIASGLNATDIGGRDVIRGLSEEFYRKCGESYHKAIEFRPESKIAAAIFQKMLRDENISIFHNDAVSVVMQSGRIGAIKCSDGAFFSAQCFIDATYEGDMLPLCSVSFSVGRESAEQFQEPHAGRTPLKPMLPYSADKISAFDTNGKLLKYIAPHEPSKVGSGDSRLQAYSFRFCVTDNPDLRVPFPEPSSFDSEDFELFRRLAASAPEQANTIHEIVFGSYGKSVTYRSGYFNLAEIANEKRDVNSGHIVPLNPPHFNQDWLSASKLGRTQIKKEYLEYTLKAWHFMLTDDAVPDNIKQFLKRWGLCQDEFVDSDNFPPLLYVREGRRLVGEQVYTEHDIMDGLPGYDDVIGVGRYHLDCKPTQWLATRAGNPAREGMFFFNPARNYFLPYWLMLPNRLECTNLLVTCAVSASHVAFASIRMEPHWMQLGEVAGVAAALSVRERCSVHTINASRLRDEVKFDLDGLLRQEIIAREREIS